MSKFTYTNHIDVVSYNALRRAVGWNEVEEEMAAIGLANSFWLLCVRDHDRPIGLTRIIGDGGYYAIIEDVIVHPDYQGKGLGQEMIQQAMDYLKAQLKPGQDVMVSLVSCEGKEAFYERFGFRARPYPGQGAGMTRWIYYEE